MNSPRQALMRLAMLRALVPLVLFAACAGPSSQRREDQLEQLRVYPFSEAKAQELVKAILAARGISLQATDDPHLLMTEPKKTVTSARTIAPADTGSSMDFGPNERPTMNLRLGEHTLFSEERTWMVEFEPVSEHATAIRIVRGGQVTWANGAERSSSMESASAAVRIDARVPVNFVRAPEEEAAVAAELDGEASVEVAEAGATAVETRPAEDPPAGTPSEGGEQCQLDEGPLTPMLAPGQVILLSDPLGAKEPWAVLAELICLAGARGLPVTVALSLPRAEQERINRYLTSEGTLADRRALLDGPFWSRPWQDGRSSVGTLETIESIRHRRAAGAPLTILAVDSGLSGNPRHALVASTLLQHRAENPQRLIVGLLGNVLTTRRAGAEWNAGLLPVGARLAAAIPAQLHAFDVSYREGSHWTCRLGEEGRLVCGTWRATPGPTQLDRSASMRPNFHVFSNTSAEGFDGTYSVGGELTASVPALEGLRKDEGQAPRGALPAGLGAPEPAVTTSAAQELTPAELYRAGHLPEGDRAVRAAIDAAIEHFGPEALEVSAQARSLGQLAEQHWRYQLARGLFLQSLRIEEHAVPSNEVRLADVLAELASLEKADMQAQRADRYARRALALREHVSGPNSAGLIDLLQILSFTADADGRFEEGEALARRAVALARTSTPANSPELASSLNSLGVSLHSRRRWANAAEVYREALEIVRVNGQATSASAAAANNNLAIVLTNLDAANTARAATGVITPAMIRQRAEIVSLFEAALAAAEASLGPHHPFTAQILDLLSEAYRSQGRGSKSLGAQERAKVARNQKALCVSTTPKEGCLAACQPGKQESTCHGACVRLNEMPQYVATRADGACFETCEEPGSRSNCAPGWVCSPLSRKERVLDHGVCVPE